MTIDIDRPWARSSPGGEQAAGFLVLTNKGGEADRLIAAQSPAAGRVEIHGIRVVGGGITMLPMERGLTLPLDMAITLKPRGYHLLFLELKKPLKAGERLPVTLTFEKGAPLQVELAVEAPGLIGNDALIEGQPG